MLAFGSSSVITVVAAVAWLVGLCVGETTELRSGKRIEFTADLERGDNWGVQFQLVDGTVAFRVRSRLLWPSLCRPPPSDAHHCVPSPSLSPS